MRKNWAKWAGIYTLAVCLTSCATDKKSESESSVSAELVGAYTEHRELKKEEFELFKQTYKLMPELTPTQVATQVVAGMNYAYTCTDNVGNLFKVTIYKPLPGQGEPRITVVEPVSVYQDIINFVQTGFQEGWQNSSPEDKGLSPVFSYRAPTAGYALIDINRDGVMELLLGDTIDDNGNDYAMYDIFTFDTRNGTLNHVLSGGERDRFHFNGGGIIIEEGANSAEDSFTKCYQLEDGDVKELPKGTAITEELMLVKVTPFVGK